MDALPLPTPRRYAGRLLRALAALLTAVVLSTGQAHGSLVLGAVSLSPDPPVAGQQLVISVVLATSGNAPVEGAKLAGELAPAAAAAPADATSAAPADSTPGIPVSFRAYPEPYGTYRAQIVAPAEGSYALTVRDHTYAKENVAATVTFQVGGKVANGALDFTFPPSGGPRSILTWLLWLVGLPLAAGVLVTVLVLRSKGAANEAEG